MTSLVMRRPSSVWPASCDASAIASVSNASSGTTRDTRPIRSASIASIVRPVSMRSNAREAPMRRGSV